MKQEYTWKSAVMGLLVAGTPVVHAEESTLSAAFDATVLTEYIWRGQVYNDETVLQPSLTVTKGGLTLNWWANNNLTDRVTGDEYEFSEHDFGVSYSFSPVEAVSLTLGVVNYDFPNTAVTDAAEIYAIAGLSSVPLAPTLSAYYDIKDVEGFYLNAGISHSIELCEYSSLGLAASLGWADEDWTAAYHGVSSSALQDLNVSLSVPTKVGAGWTLTPAVQYTTLVDSDIEDAADASGAYFNDGDVVIGSIKASYAF